MNRVDFIKNLVKDKEVLDIGGIRHSIKRESDNMWLHKHLIESASYVLGVDILEEDIKKANEMGYNFIYGNAESLDKYVEKKFDFCIAGELIEHLANPGLFLQSAKKVLKENGKLIITTANVFSFGNIFRILRYVLRNNSKDINKEHKCWYCFQTIEQLLESQGFKVEQIFSLRSERENGFLSYIKKSVYGNANPRIICVAKKI